MQLTELQLLDLVDCTYLSNAQEIESNFGYKVHESSDGTYLRCIHKVDVSMKNILVGTRGTLGDKTVEFYEHITSGNVTRAAESMGGLTNWITNFKFVDSKLDSHIIDDDSPVRVHDGFNHAASVCWEMIQKDLKGDIKDFTSKNSSDCINVYVCGHSLGAAIATILALFIERFLVQQSIKNVALHLVTFGSPRLGNLAFARLVQDRLKSRITRVVNDFDLVTYLPTSLPLTSLEYVHVCDPFNVQPVGSTFLGLLTDFLDACSKNTLLDGFKTLTAVGVDHHKPSVYRAFIQCKTGVGALGYVGTQAVKLAKVANQLYNKYITPRVKSTVAKVASISVTTAMTASSVLNTVIGTVNLGVNIHNAVMLHKLCSKMELHHTQVINSLRDLTTTANAILDGQHLILNQVKQIVQNQQIMRNIMEQGLRDILINAPLATLDSYRASIAATNEGRELRKLFETVGFTQIFGQWQNSIDDRLQSRDIDQVKSEIYSLMLCCYRYQDVRLICAVKLISFEPDKQDCYWLAIESLYTSIGFSLGRYFFQLKYKCGFEHNYEDAVIINDLHEKFIQLFPVATLETENWVTQFTCAEIDRAIALAKSADYEEAEKAVFRSLALSPHSNFDALLTLIILVQGKSKFEGKIIEDLRLVLKAMHDSTRFMGDLSSAGARTMYGEVNVVVYFMRELQSVAKAGNDLSYCTLFCTKHVITLICVAIDGSAGSKWEVNGLHACMNIFASIIDDFIKFAERNDNLFKDLLGFVENITIHLIGSSFDAAYRPKCDDASVVIFLRDWEIWIDLLYRLFSLAEENESLNLLHTTGFYNCGSRAVTSLFCLSDGISSEFRSVLSLCFKLLSAADGAYLVGSTLKNGLFMEFKSDLCNLLIRNSVDESIVLCESLWSLVDATAARSLVASGDELVAALEILYYVSTVLPKTTQAFYKIKSLGAFEKFVTMVENLMRHADRLPHTHPYDSLKITYNKIILWTAIKFVGTYWRLDPTFHGVLTKRTSGYILLASTQLTIANYKVEAHKRASALQLSERNTFKQDDVDAFVEAVKLLLASD